MPPVGERPPADRIRNVALVGHRGAGKTSLHEALLFEAGATSRLGSVPDESTVSDSDPDEQARQMSISASLSSFQWQERKINLLDTPGEPSFVADALGALRVCESAVFVINAVMGVEVTTEPPVGARGGARHRAHAVREHARPRARRLLPRARAAQGGVRPARRRHRDPDRLRARARGRDRPRRHEGLPPGLRRARRLERDRRSPTSSAERRPGIPREADGRGLRSLRRADGALPRGRGDLPRGDRRRAQGGHQPRQDLPGRVRRGHAQPRHLAAARRDRRGPALAGQARLAAGRRGRAHAERGRRAVRLRVQDARGPVRGAHQPAARLPGRDARRQPGAQHARPRQGADRAAARVRRQGRAATCTSSAPATSARWRSSRRRAPATGSRRATSRSRCRG